MVIFSCLNSSHSHAVNEGVLLYNLRTAIKKKIESTILCPSTSSIVAMSCKNLTIPVCA